MIVATDSDIGRRVIYRRPKLAWAENEGSEEGEITSVGVTYVFVRYDGDTQSKATLPRDLEWVAA